MKKENYILLALVGIFLTSMFFILRTNQAIEQKRILNNCLSLDTKIKTTEIKKRISDIQEGDIVLSDAEKPAKVIKIAKVKVADHKLLRVLLNDGTVLELSPGHPTADGRKFNDLKKGDELDGRSVVKTSIVPYGYDYTYDILPDSKTGNYYANGVLIGSALK